ncbi:MAG: hypothetical protein ACI4IH_06735 [Eubacterium sp.]
MLTENENSPNNLYLIWNEERNIKKIVTYKCNIIKEVQNCTQLSERIDMNDFSSTSVTDEKFEEFIKVARKAGYRIYKIIRL